jgi:hypothetical protein
MIVALGFGAATLIGMLVVSHVASYRLLRRMEKRDINRANREFRSSWKPLKQNPGRDQSRRAEQSRVTGR